MKDDEQDVRLDDSEPTGEQPKQRKRGDGREFEDAVYAWLCLDSKYTEIGREMRIRPRQALNPYRVDIVCVEYPQRFARWKKYELLWWGMPVVLFYPGLWAVGELMGQDAAWAFSLTVMGYWIIAMFLKERVVDRRWGRTTWIECRDRADKVTRKYVQEVERRRDDAAAYQPYEVRIVSASGFEEDALLLAQAYKIQCWERVEADFVRVV